MHYQIAKQKSQGEERIRNARKKRIEKTREKMTDCQRKHHEISYALSPSAQDKIDLMRPLDVTTFVQRLSDCVNFSN